MVTSLLVYSIYLKIRLSFEYDTRHRHKIRCWWKWILSNFKTQKLWSEDNYNTNGRGLISWHGQCCAFSFTRIGHFSHYFQTVAELRLSVQDLCPSKPHPFAQIKTDASAMHKFSQPKGIPSGTEALRHTQTASHSAHSCGSTTFKRWSYAN